MLWTRALQSGRVVRPDSYRQMTTPVPLPNGKPQRYGFGLAVRELDGHRVVSHNRRINGFGSQLASYPDESLIVAAVAHSETGLPDQLEKHIARRALGISEPRVVDLPEPPVEAGRWSGSYGLGEATVDVTAEGVHLVLRLPESQPARLLYQGDGVFVRADQRDFRMRFIGIGAWAETVEASVTGQTLMEFKGVAGSSPAVPITHVFVFQHSNVTGIA